MNNKLEKYQLNSILAIYDGYKNNQTTETAAQYYITHNSIPNGVVLSDKMVPVNGLHTISYAYYYVEDNDYDTTDNMSKPYSHYYPLLLSYENQYVENNYKLISAKDIDFENAHLKYANQKQKYNEPFEYHEVTINSNNVIEAIPKTCSTYIFGREISPYVNNSYDLLNIIDYLFNRFNCLSYVLNIIKGQKNVMQINK